MPFRTRGDHARIFRSSKSSQHNFERLTMSAPLQIGLLVFPKVTQLDLTGPVQVLSSVPEVKVHLIWKRIEPVPSDSVLTLTPTVTYPDCPQLDVICVPGGVGIDDIINDEETLDFLRKQAAGARYVTSVCTGSLVLGAAGLLKGYRSACHWAWRDMLKDFGAIPVAERVVRDRNRISGGGVTAGIDFGLTVAAELAGEEVAKSIQLVLEYDPQPPFDSGSPDKAGAERVKRIRERLAPLLQSRRRANAV